MAKQRGPHQLSGKINNLCYYEQKGVRGGLVRRINEGMSARLKDAPEFANTRGANSVFGMCSMYAGQIFSMFNRREGYLHKYDRQAILTAFIKRSYTVEHGRNYGQVLSLNSAFCELLNTGFNRIVKNKISTYLPLLDLFPLQPVEGFIFQLNFSRLELEKACDWLQCDGFQFLVYGPIGFYVPVYDSETGKYFKQESNIDGLINEWFTWEREGNDISRGFAMNFYDDAINVFYVSIIPYRKRLGRGNQELFGKAMCKMYAILGQ